MEEISDFRTSVFNAINRKNNSTGALDKLRYYQKNIYRNSTLPNPFESDTDVFLNDLSSKVINFILSSDMSAVSSELKKEISDIFGKILKGYTKIFIHFVDNNYYENFFDSCLKIFELQNPFYSSTSKTTYFSGVQDSPYYTSIINVILTSNILDKVTNYFNTVQQPEFQHFYFFLCFLRSTSSNFSTNPYKKCLELSSNKIMAICQNLEGNDLRDVNERYIHNSLLLLNKLNQYTLNDTVAKLIVEIDIKFSKSSFLKKRFAGLSTLRNFLNQNVTRKKGICSLLYSEKVLEEILKDFHHQLVNDFVALMSEMIYQNFDERKNLCEFWEVCLNQHSSTIETFFKGLYDLTRTLPEEYMNILYQKIIDTKKYPDSCLSFLSKIVYRMNDNQRAKIFESLEKFYFSIDHQPSSEGQIIATMCSFIPSNQFFCQKILEKALTMIENNSHLTLSLNLLMSSCNRIRSDQANRYFDMVTVHISGENSIQFLPLLQQIIFQLNHTLSNDQFNRLLDLTVIHFRSQDILSVEKICTFYEKLLRHSANEIFTIEMLKKLFNILCVLDPISFPVYEIIKVLFSDINNYRSYINAYNTPANSNNNINSSVVNRNPYTTTTTTTNTTTSGGGGGSVKRDNYGINDLWRLLFRTKDKYWIKFLVKTESIGNIIFKCMENYQNSAALSTLFYTIHAVEDSMNKDILNIPSNIYIDPEDTVMVNVTGELSQCLCVSKYLNYNAFLHKIAMILNRKFEYLVFEEDGRSISNRDLRIKDGATINVRCLYGSTNTKPNEIDVSRLPSRILMNEKYSSVLFGLLNDKQLGQFALKILNEMPTLDKEKVVFVQKNNSDNNDDCVYEFNWNDYLSLDDPLLLNYHLNIIGNCVSLGKEEWMRNFFETGGALRVLNLAISEKSYECIICNNCGNGYSNAQDDQQLNTPQKSDDKLNTDDQKSDKKSNENSGSKENSINANDQELKENSINGNDQELKENSINANDQELKENSSNSDLGSDKKLSENAIQQLSSKSSSFNNNIKLSESSSNESNLHNFLNTSDYTFNINFYLLLLRVARRILESPLVEQYTESLIQSFDCTSIPNFSHHIVTVGTHTNNINVISNMLYILKSLIQHRSLQASEFSNFDSLLDMTLFSPSDKIKRTIFQIIQNVPPTIYQDSFLPLLSKAFKMNCADYFTLLLPVTLETNDPIEIWNKLIDLVSIHFVPSKSLSLLDQLKFVIPSTQLSKGIFNVLNVLVDRIDEQNKEKQRKSNSIEEIPRISELFNFLVNEILLNTMKYFEITKELVNLLINLLSKKQSLAKEVIMRLKSVREARREIKTNSDFQPNMSSRTKYKGLRNLGATCYMASLLQQLFAIPIFRDSLINSSLSLEENEDNEKWLIELQYLFLKMLLFPSCDIDPSSFVKCWKGWDDKPINPREQQDAIEFLQMFLDRIESKVPITKSLFKGVILHHTDGVDCDFHQNNNEEYVNIPLEVKGHVNVSQSFETYCSPDRFDGPNQYRTDQFGMIDAIQTHRILTPSPQLIITLKRFEYNLSTMLREKVNSEYMFPISLDLSPIMVDNSKPVNYELYGVVVHMGSAQGGHYVSHIKEDDGNWYLFNDRKVTQENQNSMLTASYGGSTTSQIWDDESKTYITTTFDKGSAYLLFYRKSDFDFNAEVQENVSPVLLERLLTEIKNEILKKLESSQEYLRFVSQICVDSQFLLSFFDDSNFSIESLSTLSCKCIENCSNNPSFALEILKTVDQHISVILSEKSTPETRQMYTSILCSAMDFSPIEESKDLIDRFLIKIRDEPDSMMNYYEAFPDFFIIFEHYFNRYQQTAKTKEDSMITIWINSFSTFISRCLDNDYVRERANFSIIFNILSLILKFNIEKAPLLKPVHNKKSIRVFLCSKINSDSYTSLLVLLIQQRSLPIEDVYFIIEENDGVFVTSRLFICCLADVKYNGEENIKNLITFCNNKGTDYLISFLFEISSLAKQFKSDISVSFFALSTFWINNWLFHKSKDIRLSILSVFKSFSESSILDPTKNEQKSNFGSVYNSLLSSLPHLKSTTLSLLKLHESYKITTDNIYKQIPTEEFFDLLTWSIKSGSFYKEIAQKGLVFGQLCSAFGGYSFEYPNIHLMDFVYKIVNEFNSSEFFKDETLGLFLNGLTKIYYNDSANELKTTVLGHFIRIIPDDRSEELFNAKFFHQVIKYIFVGEMGVIVRKKIKKNIKNLTKPEMFGKTVFQTLQCTSSLNELCRISWILLKEIPSLSDVFESVGCRQFLWETVMARIQSIRMSPIVRSATTNLYSSSSSSSSHWRHPSPVDLVVFPALKLLGIFNKSYSMTNKDKSGMFWGNYVTWLANQWDKTSIQFHSIFQIALANINIEFGQSGPFIFMESLIELPVSKFANEIYSVSLQFHRPITNTNNNNSLGGVVLRSPLKVQKNAAHFVIALFDKLINAQKNQTEISVYLIEEFMACIKYYASTLNINNKSSNIAASGDNLNAGSNGSKIGNSGPIQKVSPEAIDILALRLAEMVKMLVKNDSKKLIKDMNFVLSTTNDPMMMGKGMSSLAISLFSIQLEKMQISEWKANATRILSRLLKEYIVASNNVTKIESKMIDENDDFQFKNNIENVLNFIDLIEENSDLKKKILMLSKEDLNKLLVLLKDKKSELSLRIINLVQKVLG